ncbi:MAG: DNA-processing protein DprA [Chloroflexota bacterium]|nr:DNA-processing protein DprA [Chloroflexota bacterium]
MSATRADGAKFWVGFHRVPYVGPSRIRRLIERFGDLERAWDAPAGELRTVLDERAVESLVKTRQTLSLDDEMDKIERAGVTVLTHGGEGYPRLLAEIPAPPPVLYVKGELLPEDGLAVAVVGARRLSSYGRDVGGRLAGELAAAGVTIVSGLARGIDAVAHQAALRAGGRTVAVLGCGVNVVYPPEHRNLAGQIVENGALVSDYPPDRKPDAPNFPARNRIISGLSLGVVVVEAPAKSGALITVDFAADQGRDVFVVPGNVLSSASAGCNRLLRDGARPVRDADDVLEDLNLGRRQEQQAVQQALPIAEEERRLLALLTADPQLIDELAAAANQPISQVGALLLTMELKGLVRNAGAQHYARV